MTAKLGGKVGKGVGEGVCVGELGKKKPLNV